jgi:hypothetical protein
MKFSISEEMEQALLYLAKRNNKNYTVWCDWSNNLSSDNVKCLICESTFNIGKYECHGLCHLKEKNLLPFI